MPRKKREKSETGIYHVMLRGINCQDIFIEREDFEFFRRILFELPLRHAQGKVVGNDNCSIYAYCILNNHCHILIQEREQDVSDLMKAVEDRFVFYYNKKYNRLGHLFHRPFRSEPVNDQDYFRRLLRYIHRNPVKAMLCNEPEDYEFSSWNEYVKGRYVQVPVCNTTPVLKRYGYEELSEWVHADINDECMDIGEEAKALSDEEAWKMLAQVSQCTSPDDFRRFTADQQLRCLSTIIHHGVSIRQASRLSSLTYYKIRKYLEQANRKSTEG